MNQLESLLPYILVYITMCIIFLKHSKSLTKRLLKTHTESGLLERTGATLLVGGSWILSKSRCRPLTKPFSDLTSYSRSWPLDSSAPSLRWKLPVVELTSRARLSS